MSEFNFSSDDVPSDAHEIFSHVTPEESVLVYYSHGDMNNIESLNDFSERLGLDVLEDEGTLIVVIHNSKLYFITIVGNGDFFNSIIEIEEVPKDDYKDYNFTY